MTTADGFGNEKYRFQFSLSFENVTGVLNVI